MRLHETAIPGLLLVEPTRHHDARGFFSRLCSPSDLAAAGIGFHPVDLNLSRNTARHTLRGLHVQAPPHAEAKLVGVVRGAVHDVVVDLRPGPTRGRWVAATLDAEAGRLLLVPEGCAHGFLTLEPDTDVLYAMGRAHAPGQGRGYRYDDPAFGIEWPHEPAVLSEADRAWPPFRP